MTIFLAREAARMEATRISVQGAASNAPVLEALKIMASKQDAQCKLMMGMKRKLDETHEIVKSLEANSNRQANAIKNIEIRLQISSGARNQWCSFRMKDTHDLFACRAKGPCLVCAQDSHQETNCFWKDRACSVRNMTGHSGQLHYVKDKAIQKLIRNRYGLNAFGSFL